QIPPRRSRAEPDRDAVRFSVVRGRTSLGVLVAVALVACGDQASDAPDPTNPAGSSTNPVTAQSTTAPTTTSQPILASDAPRAVVAEKAPIRPLAAGLNDAGLDLLRTQDAETNVVLSPSSIGHALLMARGAADAPTAAAIDEAFGLPRRSHEAWNAIDQRIAASQRKHVTVTIADRLWPRTGLEPDQEWVDLLASHHGAGVEPLDLTGDPEASRKRINAWVDEQTKGLIPELLPSGSIDPSSLLVLTDTLYFKARWQTTFGKYGPLDSTFTRLDGSTVPVELMQELELGDRRGEGDGFVGAEIPYVGDDYSMLLVVPDEGRFAEIRDGLDQAMLDEIDATFTTGPYELRLPKWKTKTAVDLFPWLTELGAAPGAYPGISDGAFLGGAYHAADIEVDEWGTVAAAATGLVFAESGPPDPELVVAADQPFLYLIRHRASGLVLFAGQVTDPTA
ncbi:MAG: serpin family protein, partial [Actinomycetota bacterium]|nr:serpin family protein [Actinomycetota bacterium]